MSRELLMQNNYEWGTAEGQTLEIENAIRSNVRDLKIEGQTYQNLIDVGSLNPSHGYTIDKVNEIITYYEHNTANQFNTPLLKDNTSYTFICNVISVPSNIDTPIRINDTGNNYDLNILAFNPATPGLYKVKFTTRSGYEPLAMNFYSNTKNVGFSCNYPIILEGDFTNTELPTSINGIESVAERESKNLLENVKWHDGFVEVNGTITTNSSYPNAKYSNLIPVNIKTLYYSNLPQDSTDAQKQIRMRGYTADGVGIKDMIFPSSFNAMFNARNEDGWRDVKYIRIMILNSSVYQLPSNPILMPSPYTETDMYPLQITQSHYDTDGIVLPNGVENTIENGVHVKRIGKVILNGSEQWRVNAISGATTTTRFGLYGEGLINAKVKGSCLCDRFPNIDSDLDNEHIKIGSPTPRFFIYINKSRLSTDDVDGFKEYLSNNPILLYYELETPITEPCVVTEVNMPIPLRSLPKNNVRDTIENGKLIQRVGVFNASKNYSSAKWMGNLSPFLEFDFMHDYAKQNDNVYCNTLPYKPMGYNSEHNEKGFSTQVGFRIKPFEEDNKTREEYETWLKENETIIYYELVNPIVHELNIPPISIAKGGNIITTTNNIQPNLKFKYKKSKK